MRQHPGRRTCPEQIGELFGEAFYKAVTPENAKSGFNACGIVPFNDNVIPEDQFVAIPQPADETLSLSLEKSSDTVELNHDDPSTSGVGSFTIMETTADNVKFSDLLPVPEFKMPKKRWRAIRNSYKLSLQKLPPGISISKREKREGKEQESSKT